MVFKSISQYEPLQLACRQPPVDRNARGMKMFRFLTRIHEPLFSMMVGDVP